MGIPILEGVPIFLVNMGTMYLYSRKYRYGGNRFSINIGTQDTQFYLTPVFPYEVATKVMGK